MPLRLMQSEVHRPFYEPTALQLQKILKFAAIASIIICGYSIKRTLTTFKQQFYENALINSTMKQI